MKANGSIASLVQGVSQQEPQDRRPGQHGEAINTIPDPVLGLARRHGTEWQAERIVTADTFFDETAEDVASFRTFEYTSGSVEYVLMYRPHDKVVNSVVGPVIVYDKTNKQFIPVSLVAGTNVTALANGGLSAIAAAGRYVFMAGNDILTDGQSVDLWGAAANQARAVAWIRGGAYSRTYSVRAVKTDNTVVNFSYTTPASSYAGTLDTSKVPVYAADPAGGTTSDTEAAYITADGSFGIATLGWAAWNPSAMTVKDSTTTLTNVTPADPANATQYSWAAGAPTIRFHASLIGDLNVTLQYTHTKTVANPNYAKQIADITAAYNSAVTQWIGTAAAAIAPNAIAEQLKLAAVAAGLSSAVRVDSTVVFDNIKEIAMQDGGDGSLVRGVANTINTIDQVSTVHYVGKIVKVQTASSADAFYLKAIPKITGATGFAEVTWVEGAGVEHTISKAFCYGTMHSGTFYIAESATALATAVPGPHPDFSVSTVGDGDTSPMPYFVGKRITYLGVFQDRLLIGSDAVIQCSETSEYLNFFRGSAVTLVGSDPYELQAQGTEDDEIRFSVLYDRDLVLFGKKRQYVIPGRVPMSPLNASMPVMSKHTGAADAPPITSGSIIFYAKRGEKSTSVHQIQPGNVAESPESYLASSQLDDYLPANTVEIMAVAKPTVLVLRSSESNKLFLFHYLDQQDGRRQDAWHQWQFKSEVGTICGMAEQQDNFLLFTLRKDAGIMYLVADLCSMVANLSTHPYLDSQRTWPIPVGSSSISGSSVGDFAAAFDSSSPRKFLGDSLANVTALQAQYPDGTGLRCGILMDSEFEPTNPFAEDRNGKAITTGQLTVTKLVVSYRDSSGWSSTMTAGQQVIEQVFNARILGSLMNNIGVITIDSDQTTIPIGKETRDYTLRIKSLNWLPLNLTKIEWVGQFFNRPQRI